MKNQKVKKQPAANWVYSDVLQACQWCLRYGQLTGAEFKVYFVMASYADYSTGKVTISLGELCKESGCVQRTVICAIEKLINLNAIAECKQHSGRRAKTYQLRKAETMTSLNKETSHNPDYKEWRSRFESEFKELNAKIYAIINKTAKCEDCTAGKFDSDIFEDETNYCLFHVTEKKYLEKTKDFAFQKVWLEENPQPPAEITTINGIEVI